MRVLAMRYDMPSRAILKGFRFFPQAVKFQQIVLINSALAPRIRVTHPTRMSPGLRLPNANTGGVSWIRFGGLVEIRTTLLIRKINIPVSLFAA
jgi:hypothetical protein